jgi:hypothetical protein
LLEYGVVFAGPAWAIRRVMVSNLLGVDGSHLKRLAKTMQWQSLYQKLIQISNYMDLIQRDLSDAVDYCPFLSVRTSRATTIQDIRFHYNHRKAKPE